MAGITLLGSSFDTNSGTHTVTATPKAGSLIVIVTASTGNVASTTCTDNNAGGAGAYATINTAVKATSADTMMAQIRTVRVASPTSTVFTHAPGASSGGGLAVYQVTGMHTEGASAALQSQVQSNQSAATPAPVLGATPKLWNPVIAACFNATNAAALTPRAGYTEDVDTGYASPTTGFQSMWRNEGETTATITWGGASGSAFCSIVVELNSRLMGFPENYQSIKGGSGLWFSDRIR